MAYFTGTYLHSLDDRGRLALPAKLREKLGDKVAVTYAHASGSLAVYPLEQWEATAEQVLKELPTNDEGNNIRLHFFGNASEGSLDGQGRIPIPENLRRSAELSGEVAVVGAGDHIQIWDKQKWVAKQAALRSDPPSMRTMRSAEHATRS